MLRRYAAVLFGLAAAFNAAVGLALLFARPLVGPALGLDPIVGTNLVLLSLSAGLIVFFAWIYLLIALDPAKQRPVIPLMAVGKLVGFASVAWPWLAGAVDARLPALAAGDLVFALLFFDYLRRPRASPA
jgi:hypothetical protein